MKGKAKAEPRYNITFFLNMEKLQSKKEFHAQGAECWFDVKGYEGIYEVSTLGNVRRTYANGKTKILKPQMMRTGYVYVGLCKDGVARMTQVHRIVAEALLPNRFGYKFINHLDEDKTNNAVWNLEWCSLHRNLHYGTRNARIAESHTGVRRVSVMKEVHELDGNGRVIGCWMSLTDCAREMGVKPACIATVIHRGGRWHGRKFIYANAR